MDTVRYWKYEFSGDIDHLTVTSKIIHQYEQEGIKRLTGGNDADVRYISKCKKYVIFTVKPDGHLIIDNHCIDFGSVYGMLNDEFEKEIDSNSYKHVSTSFVIDTENGKRTVYETVEDKFGKVHNDILLKLGYEERVGIAASKAIVDNMEDNARYCCFSDVHGDLGAYTTAIYLWKSKLNMWLFALGDTINQKWDYWGDNRKVSQWDPDVEFRFRDYYIHALDERNIEGTYIPLHGNHDASNLGMIPTRVVIINKNYQLVFQHALMNNKFEEMIDDSQTVEIKDVDAIYLYYPKEIAVEREFKAKEVGRENIWNCVDQMAEPLKKYQEYDDVTELYSTLSEIDEALKRFKASTIDSASEYYNHVKMNLDKLIEHLPDDCKKMPEYKKLRDYAEKNEAVQRYNDFVIALKKAIKEDERYQKYNPIMAEIKHIDDRYDLLTTNYFLRATRRTKDIRNNEYDKVDVKDLDANIKACIDKSASKAKVDITYNPYIVLGHDYTYFFIAGLISLGNNTVPVNDLKIGDTILPMMVSDDKSNNEFSDYRKNYIGIFSRIYSTDGDIPSLYWEFLNSQKREIRGGKTMISTGAIVAIVIAAVIVIAIICYVVIYVSTIKQMKEIADEFSTK